MRHSGAHAASSMSMSMSTGLPTWLGVLWAALFAVLLLWHLAHAAGAHGGRRLWHVGHVAMAATMIAMYLPVAATADLVGGLGWPLPVAVAAVLLVVGLAAQPVPPGLRLGLWVLTAVDLAAMAAMWVPAAAGVVLGCVLAAIMCAAMVTMAGLLPAPASPPA